MKKSIAFIGAFFMGAFAFAQVSKTDTINKTAGRKVLNDDMKNVPAETESKKHVGNIKWSADKKTNEDGYIKMTDVKSRTGNENVTVKGKESTAVAKESQSKSAYKVTSNKAEVDAAKESQSKAAYKMTSTKAEAVAPSESTKVSDPYFKISSAKEK